MSQETDGSYFRHKHLKQIVLSYSQFIANGQAKLGQHYIEALTTFFFNLEIHDYCNKSKGNEVLLFYACCSRCEWHTKLKLNKGFNIMIINTRLLWEVLNEIWDEHR